MIMGQKFQNVDFFARPVEEVAPDLIGCFLFTSFGSKRAGGMIIETEAYDENDVFAHCFVGARDTAKAQSAPMYGEPGNVYLYWNGAAGLAINISCDRKSFGSAVLIRAIEPLDQECAEAMKAWRLDAPGASEELKGANFRAILSNGPAKVGDALGLDESEHDLSKREMLTIIRSPFVLYHRSDVCSPISTPRKGLDRMYEKFVKEEPTRAGHKDADAHRLREWRWIRAAAAKKGAHV